MTTLRTSAVAAGALVMALLAPSPASATDDEIRQAVTDGAARIVEQEEKVTAVAKRFSESKRPSRALVRKFRAAAREEEAVIRDVRADIRKPDASTEDVGEGRNLMAAGLAKIARGLDRIDKALGRALRGGSAKSVSRSITKAQKEIVSGNRQIEKGEPLVGAELTPNTPTEESAS